MVNGLYTVCYLATDTTFLTSPHAKNASNQWQAFNFQTEETEVLF